MIRNPAEMTGYASLYPGVDHHPNREDDPRWHRPADHFHACYGCGQTAIDGTGKCATCRGRESAPQGTQQALFTPPPAQLAGQLAF